MSKSKRTLPRKLKFKKPVSVLFKRVKADFKDLFKALAKGVGRAHGHAGKLQGPQTTREHGEALCLHSLWRVESLWNG